MLHAPHPVQVPVHGGPVSEPAGGGGGMTNRGGIICPSGLHQATVLALTRMPASLANPQFGPAAASEQPRLCSFQQFVRLGDHTQLSSFSQSQKGDLAQRMLELVSANPFKLLTKPTPTICDELRSSIVRDVQNAPWARPHGTIRKYVHASGGGKTVRTGKLGSASPQQSAGVMLLRRSKKSHTCKMKRHVVLCHMHTINL